MKTGIIYIATNTVNGMQYVGQTIQPLKKRKSQRYNKYFRNAIQKYRDLITWEVVATFPIEWLDDFEQRYISELKTVYPNGYNFESGGHKNKVMSQVTKDKLSKANKGKKKPPISEETRERMSKAAKGRISPRKGVKLSKTTKRKMSKAKKGTKCSETTKRKMSLAHYGKRHSQETKEEMSRTRKGRKLPPETEETRKRKSKAHIGIPWSKARRAAHENNAKR